MACFAHGLRTTDLLKKKKLLNQFYTLDKSYADPKL